jgi:tetratricopeptide (TPR) repeat protein
MTPESIVKEKCLKFPTSMVDMSAHFRICRSGIHRDLTFYFPLAAALFPILRVTTSPGPNSNREPCPECRSPWRSRLVENTLKRAVRRIWSAFLLTAVTLVSCWATAMAQINSKTSKAEVEGGTRATVLTKKDTIVLADFENKTGDSVFDHALKQALVIELGQSPFLNPLSDGKIKENLQIMGRSINEPISADLGRELCLRTDSKAVLTGTISNLGGRYVLDLAVRACSTGDILAKEHGESASKQGVLKILSQASATLRMKLGESSSSVQRFHTPVETTTTSIEALRNYSIGTSLQREKGDAPSIPFLKRAIEIDPNFPLAYAALAAVYRNFRQPSLALEYATKAYKLRDRVNEREKLRISAAYYSAEGELENEIKPTNYGKQAILVISLPPRNHGGPPRNPIAWDFLKSIHAFIVSNQSFLASSIAYRSLGLKLTIGLLLWYYLRRFSSDFVGVIRWQKEARFPIWKAVFNCQSQPKGCPCSTKRKYAHLKMSYETQSMTRFETFRPLRRSFATLFKRLKSRSINCPKTSARQPTASISKRSES